MREKIFHFPLDRSSTIKPELTVAIKSEENGVLLTYAICSNNDQFEKRVGRTIALRRSENSYGFKGSITSSTAQLITKLQALNARHPGTISPRTVADLLRLPELYKKRIAERSYN